MELTIFSNPDDWAINDNIYLKKNREEIKSSYTDDSQNVLFDHIEDDSWWFQYRSQVISSISEKYIDKHFCIYDIGGGNGYTTYNLQKSGRNVVLVEPTLQACKNGKQRGINTVVSATINDDDYLDNSLDSCSLLDVLEHIEDDDSFLETLHNKLVPNGKLLIAVPAFMSLWSSEDEEVSHFRRYKKNEVADKLKKHGFKILYANYFFGFLYLPILFVRVWGEKLGLLKKTSKRNHQEKIDTTKNQHSAKNPIVAFVLKTLERMEMSLLKNNVPIWFGSSVIVVAKK